MKIITVVVTYNRLALLKECIAAILSQTTKSDEIIVVNNGSTDDTGEWLTTQPVTIITQENKGGSFGFYTGIKQAYQNNADWIWLMDDDTIPDPAALAQLVTVTQNPLQRIGFLSSKAIWTDGTPHLMNVPDIKTFAGGQPFNANDQYGLYRVNAASFVSLFLARQAVAETGLPFKEFFIWGDDSEYTQRIVRRNFVGGYIPASVVLHKTPVNHFSNIFLDSPQSIWKYRYGLRNELFMVKLNKGKGKFWGQFFKRIFVFPVRILKKRKDHRWLFIRTVWGASISAIGFNPQIEKL